MRFFSSLPGFLIPCLLLALPALPAAAQSTDAGSVYSRFGLGELQRFGSSQIEGMGGGGAGLWSYNYPNFDNPAALRYQAFTRLNAGLRLQQLSVSNAAGDSNGLRSGDLGAVQLGIPLKTGKIGLGVGFEPYSRVHYRVRTEGQLATDPMADTSYTYRINHEGTGGLQKVSAGLGVQVTDNLSLGVGAAMLFGIIEEGQRNEFITGNLAETNVTTNTQFRGFTGNVGVLFNQPNLFRTDDNVSAGISFTLPASLDADRSRTLGESLDRDTLGVAVKGDVDLPWSLRAGLAYQTDGRWVATAGILYEPWTQFESTLPFPGVASGETDRLRDRIRISAGGEVIPAGNDQLEPFFARTAYRLGFYFDRSYVTPDAGRTLNTMAITLGFGLPTLFPGTHLDLNVEAGTRGVAEASLVRDRFVGVSATLNIGERWFVKRKLR